MDFCLFPRSHGKLIFQGKGHGKLTEFCRNRQFHTRYNGCGSILVCIYTFSSFLHALSCMYFNVSLVMIVAVRGDHLYFSKKFKFMVRVYFQLCLTIYS